MTTTEFLAHLESFGVSFVPGQAGTLQCVAPKGVLTPRLRFCIRVSKQEILQLLAARAQPMDTTLPVPTASRYRRWVPGNAPDGTFKLAVPKYHDSPSPATTYWGTLCTKKACRKSDPRATRSLRFFPSDMCVSCWERAEKTTTREEGTDGSLD